MAEPGLFEIIHTTRAMKRLKPDPIPRALIHKVLVKLNGVTAKTNPSSGLCSR